MICYESMFILKPTLVEDEIKSQIAFFKDIITKNGGEIETCLDMGMRDLAYEIKKNKRGYYFVIYFKAQSSLIIELERNYRINEEILRFIVIKYGSKKEQKAWQVLVNQANGKAEVPKPKPPRKREAPKEASAKPKDDDNALDSELES